MFSRDDIERLVDAGVRVRAIDGQRVGRLGATVVVDAQGQPRWVSVQTGLLKAFRAFIPLRGARMDGTELLVPHTSEEITSVPLVAEDGHLRPEEEQRLRHHYGINT